MCKFDQFGQICAIYHKRRLYQERQSAEERREDSYPQPAVFTGDSKQNPKQWSKKQKVCKHREFGSGFRDGSIEKCVQPLQSGVLHKMR